MVETSGEGTDGLERMKIIADRQRMERGSELQVLNGTETIRSWPAMRHGSCLEGLITSLTWRERAAIRNRMTVNNNGHRPGPREGLQGNNKVGGEGGGGAAPKGKRGEIKIG